MTTGDCESATTAATATLRRGPAGRRPRAWIAPEGSYPPFDDPSFSAPPPPRERSPRCAVGRCTHLDKLFLRFFRQEIFLLSRQLRHSFQVGEPRESTDGAVAARALKAVVHHRSSIGGVHSLTAGYASIGPRRRHDAPALRELEQYLGVGQLPPWLRVVLHREHLDVGSGVPMDHQRGDAVIPARPEISLDGPPGGIRHDVGQFDAGFGLAREPEVFEQQRRWPTTEASASGSPTTTVPNLLVPSHRPSHRSPNGRGRIAGLVRTSRWWRSGRPSCGRRS